MEDKSQEQGYTYDIAYISLELAYIYELSGRFNKAFRLVRRL